MQVDDGPEEGEVVGPGEAPGGAPGAFVYNNSRIPAPPPGLPPSRSAGLPVDKVHSWYNCRSSFEDLAAKLTEYHAARLVGAMQDQLQNCINARIEDQADKLRRGWPEDLGHTLIIRWLQQTLRFVNDFLIPNNFKDVQFVFIDSEYNKNFGIRTFENRVNERGAPILIQRIYNINHNDIYGGDAVIVGGKRKAKRKTHKRKNKKAKTRRNRRK